MTKKTKCLLLFSGGLDSILAARILAEQGIKILGLTFKSCFFNEKQAKEVALQLRSGQAKKIGLKLKIIDVSKEHLKIVRNPKYGYGKNMNPCIDCHLLMLKEAKLLMKKLKYDFIATGEVLGERPMSQNKNVLRLLEKESGLKGYLLRPLSAKLLKPTIAEKEGIIDREKLFAISGRQRKTQIALAKKFKIKNYPTPSGGCRLTDPQFSKRLKDLLEKWPKADCNDMELLRYGRCFWERNFLIVVGRDDSENKEIKRIKMRGDLIIELKKIPGPTTLVRGPNKKAPESVIKRAKDLTKHYFNKAKNKKDINFVVS
jgi:tRNA U34 2-thiouridine synthase MnmA/TrmU